MGNLPPDVKEKEVDDLFYKVRSLFSRSTAFTGKGRQLGDPVSRRQPSMRRAVARYSVRSRA